MQHRTIFNSPQSLHPKPLLSTMESKSAKHCSLLVGWPLKITSAWHPLLFDMMQPPEIILKCKFSFHCNWFTAISGLYHNTTTVGSVACNQHKIAGSHHHLGCGGVFCIGFKQLLIVGGSANDVSLSLKNGVIDHSQSSAVFQRANIGSTNIGT